MERLFQLLSLTTLLTTLFACTPPYTPHFIVDAPYYPAQAIQFGDRNAGEQITGLVRIIPAVDDRYIEYYSIYFGKAFCEKVGEERYSLNVYHPTLLYQLYNDDVPAGADRLLAFSVNAAGENPVCAELTNQLNLLSPIPIPTETASSISFIKFYERKKANL